MHDGAGHEHKGLMRTASTIERQPARPLGAAVLGWILLVQRHRYSTAVPDAWRNPSTAQGRKIELDLQTFVVLGLTIGGAYMLRSLFVGLADVHVVDDRNAAALARPAGRAVQRRFHFGRRSTVVVVFSGFLVLVAAVGALLVRVPSNRLKFSTSPR
jgi:hypothetical protein